jgi:hypothetical protein
MGLAQIVCFHSVCIFCDGAAARLEILLGASCRAAHARHSWQLHYWQLPDPMSAAQRSPAHLYLPTYLQCPSAAGQGDPLGAASVLRHHSTPVQAVLSAVGVPAALCSSCHAACLATAPGTLKCQEWAAAPVRVFSVHRGSQKHCLEGGQTCHAGPTCACPWCCPFCLLRHWLLVLQVPQPQGQRREQVLQKPL